MQLYIITEKRKLCTYADSWEGAKTLIRSYFAREDGEISENLAKTWTSPKGIEYVVEIWKIEPEENHNMTDEMIDELEEEEEQERRDMED